MIQLMLTKKEVSKITKNVIKKLQQNLVYVQHFYCPNVSALNQAVIYKRKEPLRVSRAKCGILILIPVCAVVLSKVHWVSECCGDIIYVFFKLNKTLKAEHCLRA